MRFKPSYYFPHYWRLKTSKITSFSNSLVFNFAFWRNFATELNGGPTCGEKKTVRNIPMTSYAALRARSFLPSGSKPRLLSAEQKEREVPGDGAQLPLHGLYKSSLIFLSPTLPFFSVAVKLFDLQILC